MRDAAPYARFLIALAFALALVCQAGAAQPIDLSQVVNRGFADELADNGKGGWTDQGGNDFRHMPTGDLSLCGVPFRILDPATNDGKSCLLLRGRDRQDLPASATIAVGRKAASLAFLHTLAWGDREKPVAVYVVHYADDTSVEVPVRDGDNILGWWGHQETEQVKIAVASENLATRAISLHAWSWTNPRPEAEIARLECRSTNSQGIPILVALTALDTPVALTSEWRPPALPLPGTLRLEGETFTTFNVPPHVRNAKTDVLGYGNWEDTAFSGGGVFELRPGPQGPKIDPNATLPEWERTRTLQVSYDFTVDAAADYALWARLGPANVFSPFRWRLDDGEWGEVTHQTPFLDMYEVSFWVTMGWLNLGTRPLTAGPHTLYLEVPDPNAPKTDSAKIEAAMDDLEGTMLGLDAPRPKTPPTLGKKKNKQDDDEDKERWGIMLDCIEITRVPFHPSGTLRPGETTNRIPWWDEPARQHRRDFSSEPISSDGGRERFDLNGLWELARDQEPIPSPDLADEARLRGPIQTLTDPATLAWMGVTVPHTQARPEEGLLWKKWYRTQVSLPRELHGKRVSIHFGEANYTASVFVNGQLCGTHVGGYVPFSIDITDALKPVGPNDILIGIKGQGYYRAEYRPEIPWDFRVAFGRSMLVPGRTGWNKANHDGLGGDVWLETHGAVVGEWPFAQAHWDARTLQASVEVANRSGQPFTGKVVFRVLEPDSETVVATLGEQPLTLAAGATSTAETTGDASALTPWWSEPGRAKLYRLRTEILAADGTRIDTCDTRFGYREVRIDGPHILINGVRLNARSVITGNQETLEATLAQWRQYGCNTLRLPHGGWAGFFDGSQRRMLDWMDEQGIAVRYNSQINGMFIDLATQDPRFWDNATEYLKQFVRGFRNHPSILIWTAENELDLISNMSNNETFKRREWAMMAAAKALDPSRPMMGDGAGDLLGECEICNWHYPEVGPIADPNDAATLREREAGGIQAVYPDNAFSFARLPKKDQTRPWDRQRPLWVGETYFYSGKISWQAWIGGDQALRSRDDADLASARFLDILARGYRWQDVAGFNLFVHADRVPHDLIAKALAPVAVHTRDYQRRQFGGEPFTWRLKFYNDSFGAAPITFDWALVVDGKATASASEQLAIPPGENAERTLTVPTAPLPASANGRQDATIRLRLSRGGAVVFEEAYPVSLYAPVKGLTLPGTPRLLVFDPAKGVAPALAAMGLHADAISDLADLPPEAANTLLVVGPNAFGKRMSPPLKRLSEWAKSGGQVLVLEQNQPYPADALPFPVASQTAESAYAWPRGAHPVLAGVRKDDLSVWGAGQSVFRYPFARSAAWPLIVDASSRDGLDLAPMVESTWGKGRLVLCQLLIAENINTEPVAQRLLANTLRYLADSAAAASAPVPMTSFLPKDSLDYGSIRDAGFTGKYADADRDNTMDLGLATMGDRGVVLVPGSAATLEWLNGGRAGLRAFAERGGWIVVQGLEAAAVPALGDLVGQPLDYRPTFRERVRVERPEEPLLRGIGSWDLYWEQKLDREAAEEARFLFGDLPLRDDVLRGALLYRDIAALANNRGVANGLTNNDHWQYIHYGGERLALDWRRPFEIERVTVRESRTYRRIDELTLIFDGDPATAITQAVTSPEGAPIVFTFPPRKASRIELVASKYTRVKPSGPFGWDTVEIDRALSKDFQEAVIPLTRPAGIVKFPIGKGGILLNTVSLSEPKGDHVLLQLLHNLGVPRGSASDATSAAIDDLPGLDF